MSEAADTDLDTELDDALFDADEPDEDEAPEGEEDEGEGEEDEEAAAAKLKAEKKPETERGDLPPEEVAKRYANTKVALQAERRQRRELEQRLEALERGEPARKPAEARGRAEPEEEIDPETDPMGALKQMRAKIAAYEAQEREETQTQAQREAQEAAISQVERQFAEHEEDFREERPDYDDAARHYAESRARELLSFGIASQNIQPMLRKEFASLAATAIGAKKNPAAVVYEMAKGRGYVKGGKPKADAEGEAGKKPSTKLKDIARGARAASVMKPAGGRVGGVDAETVSRINIRSREGREAFEREFAKLEKVSGGARR